MSEDDDARQDGAGQDGLTAFPVDRRRALLGGVITGLTLATTRVEAQVIHTPTDGIDAGEMQVPTADGALPGYYARPQGPGPFPIVVVNEEIFGLHDYIKDVCRRFARLGCMAVAVEVYARLGDLSKMTSGSELMGVVAREPDAQLMADTDSLVAWAGANKGDPSRLGTTGFCRGGRTTWLYAIHNPRLKAAVAWYGHVNTPRTPIQPEPVMAIADRLGCPLLGLYGAKDTGIAVADVQATAARARAAGKTVEIHVYPDAGHGFFADYRPSYVAADAQDGWARLQDWFRRYGVMPAA